HHHSFLQHGHHVKNRGNAALVVHRHVYSRCLHRSGNSRPRKHRQELWKKWFVRGRSDLPAIRLLSDPRLRQRRVQPHPETVRLIHSTAKTFREGASVEPPRSPLRPTHGSPPRLQRCNG